MREKDNSHEHCNEKKNSHTNFCNTFLIKKEQHSRYKCDDSNISRTEIGMPKTKLNNINN